MKERPILFSAPMVRAILESPAIDEARVEYRALWESINGAGSWDAVPERASQIGDEIWADLDRLAERAADAITPELLAMANNGAPHYLIGFVFMRNLHAAVEAYARQRADDEGEGLVERSCSDARTATFVKKLEDWRSDARLYRVWPPMRDEEFFDGEYRECLRDHVIVSAVMAPYSGPETYIFPADEDGRALSMLEMSGSFKGALDHAQALANAGYLIAPPLPDCDGCRVDRAGEVECCQEKP